MNPIIILQILQTALALAGEGTQVYNFLSSAFGRLQAAQAAGTDPTPQDWAFLDQTAAQYLAQLKGYASLTSALLALQAPTPQESTGT